MLKSRFANFGGWMRLRIAGSPAQGSAAARRQADPAIAYRALRRVSVIMPDSLARLNERFFAKLEANAQTGEVLPRGRRPLRASGEGATGGVPHGRRARCRRHPRLEQIEPRAFDRRQRTHE